MGKYINNINGASIGTSFRSKCATLENSGAVKVTDKEFLPNMVCVVDNGFFAAAAYAYSEREYEEFKYPCGRHKQWYTLEEVEKHIDQ